MDGVITNTRWKQKQRDLQQKNAEAQRRHVNIKKLPGISLKPRSGDVETYLLPNVDGWDVDQHVQWQWNLQQWEELKKIAGVGVVDPVVWAMNVIAELQAMWIEATDERDELRKELELKEWTE